MVFLQQLIALIVAETVKQVLENLPAIAAAWRQATQDTLTDAGQAPKATLDAIDAQLHSVGVSRASAD